MGDEVSFGKGDRVRHRDAPEDGPVGIVMAVAAHTTDGQPIYQVGYRSRTGSLSPTRYPGANLVLVERAEPQAG